MTLTAKAGEAHALNCFPPKVIPRHSAITPAQPNPRGDAGWGPSLSPPGCLPHLWGPLLPRRWDRYQLSPTLVSSPPRWRASPKGLRAAEQPCPSSQVWRQLQGIFPPAKNRRGREKADAPWAFSASFSPLTPLTPPASPPQTPLSDPSVVMQPPEGDFPTKDAPQDSVTWPAKKLPHVLCGAMPSRTVYFQPLLNYFEN